MIGTLTHHLLALVHVGRDNDIHQAVVAPPVIHHELGNDSRDLTAGVERAVGHSAHQPHSATAVHTSPATLCQKVAQFTRIGQIALVDIGA